MLTRRDKLLNRPWQLRRYNNHRHKGSIVQLVLNALPAIDFGPPTERKHVTCKLKKLQSEGERRQRIEEENFKLLQKMGSIMSKNRLENHWRTPPPDFLHRVGIYHRTRSPTPYREIEESLQGSSETGKRRGCSACSPTIPKGPTIPEERVPWNPPKPRISQRRTSSPAVKPYSDFDVPKEKKKLSPKNEIANLPAVPLPRSDASAKKKFPMHAENRLVLTKGSLKLSVNFPPYAEVKIISGDEGKVIQRGQCHCKAFLARNANEAEAILKNKCN